MSKFANKFLHTLEEDAAPKKLLLGKKLILKKTPLIKDVAVTTVDVKKGKKPVVKSAFAKAVDFTIAKEAAGDDIAPDVQSKPTAAAPEADPSDEQAWKTSLDKNTNPADFDVEDNPRLDVDVSGIKAAVEWVHKLEDMAEFVNGTGPESLNSQINQLEIKNSVPFRGVVRREEKRITKLAENLRGLAEVFKSVIITSEKKVKDSQAPR